MIVITIFLSQDMVSRVLPILIPLSLFLSLFLSLCLSSFNMIILLSLCCCICLSTGVCLLVCPCLSLSPPLSVSPSECVCVWECACTHAFFFTLWWTDCITDHLSMCLTMIHIPYQLMLQREDGSILQASPDYVCCGTAVIFKLANPVFWPENSLLYWDNVQSCILGQLEKLRNSSLFRTWEKLATVVLTNSLWTGARQSNGALGQGR